MFGAIVLRDIPKVEARIDLVRIRVQGGFCGFSMVPPNIWHYVSVKSGQHHVGFWCWLDPNQAVVKVFDDKKFNDADPDDQAQFSQLALSGAMGQALAPYAHERLGPWLGLVAHIPKVNFPPELAAQDAGTGSRFDKALVGTHGGNAQAFLAEFQFAFARWLVSLDTPAEDEAALARWRHLVLAAYNAGEDRIRQSSDLFLHLIDTLLSQLALLPDSWFGADSFLVSAQAGYLSEDMIDTDVPELAQKGRALADYLKSRQG